MVYLRTGSIGQFVLGALSNSGVQRARGMLATQPTVAAAIYASTGEKDLPWEQLEAVTKFRLQPLTASSSFACRSLLALRAPSQEIRTQFDWRGASRQGYNPATAGSLSRAKAQLGIIPPSPSF
jgi:hypothetical protein